MEKQVTIADVYVELKKIEKAMVTKKEMEAVLETVSILSNEDTMDQIVESEKNIKEGKVKEINSVEDI